MTKLQFPTMAETETNDDTKHCTEMQLNMIEVIDAQLHKKTKYRAWYILDGLTDKQLQQVRTFIASFYEEPR